jgi:hypothetical protein
MLRMALDQGIDVCSAIGRGPEQVIGKTTHVLAHLVPLRPEGATNIVGTLPAHVGLKEHLQSQFAGFSSRPHKSSSVTGFWPLVVR